jgi:hypothetical protein
MCVHSVCVLDEFLQKPARRLEYSSEAEEPVSAAFLSRFLESAVLAGVNQWVTRNGGLVLPGSVTAFTFQMPVQAGSTDAQKLSGAHAIAAACLERSADVLLAHFLQRHRLP